MFLAALLFGVLYQGGAELAFEMPAISREMIVVIQALVILFTGALDNMVRMPVERFFLHRRRTRGRALLMELRPTILPILDSDAAAGDAAAARLPRRAVLRTRGHLRHRAGGQDAGRGLLLRRRRPRSPARSGSGLLAGIAASMVFALIHGLASITFRGNQLISGVAINFLASGLTVLIAQDWFSARAAARRR